MEKTKIFLTALTGCLVLGGCIHQSTPSMMNTSRAELVSQTSMEQVPLSGVDDGYLSSLAAQYDRYGDGPIDLTMTYNPKSKSFTSMKAVSELARINRTLAQKGIVNVKTATMPVEGEEPVLMVSFDTVHAQAPSDCGEMPALRDHNTSRDINGYRFGCGVETMLARQISRPGDLRGKETTGSADARRATSIVEVHRTVDPERVRSELEVFGREEISGE
ncbi:MAG: hypothetical protein H6853_04415 [Rhodospirillales bacterium]|nr:hypothetical protein [Alphaproteobacteria bacterium]USO04513.1 MAG: hypothetical protein H6853_04415 [Rhodospirillales bacterium]